MPVNSDPAPSTSPTFTVTMLAPMHEPLRTWLRAWGLLLVQVPDTAPDQWVVVPAPDHPLMAARPATVADDL